MTGVHILMWMDAYDSDRELIPTRPLDESIIDHNDDMHSDESDTIWTT